MRVIVRKERPHPGAQLRITDADGWRITAFATNTDAGGPELSCPTWNCGTAAGPAPRTGSASAKDTGLTNLPLHDFAQNQIWCAIVALACELTRLDGRCSPSHRARRDARRWEPKRLRLRLLSHPRPTRPHRPGAPALRLAVTPWTGLAHTAWRRLVPG